MTSWWSLMKSYSVILDDCFFAAGEVVVGTVHDHPNKEYDVCRIEQA
jgi:hypothetical protein